MLKRVWENLQIALRPAWQSAEVVALYAVVAEQARQPAFYRQGGVPDTIDGRFDLLTLHLVLLLCRLHGGGRAAEQMRQHLFDLLAADMDRNLRELGVGDMGISRRVKVMGQAFWGRLAAYDAAFKAEPAQRHTALMTTLDKNLYGTVPSTETVLAQMARYVLAARDSLDQQAPALILSGKLSFPEFKPEFESEHAGSAARE